MVTEVGRDMNAQDDQHMQRLGKAQQFKVSQSREVDSMSMDC